MALLPLLLLCVTWGTMAGGPYGLAKLPPMGWRSWNCYQANVTQEKMERVMDSMVKKRSVPSAGKDMSLLDLGYVNCGLDDAWQACGKGVDGSFHTEWGVPIVDKTRFPDMKAMTDYGHQRGLHVGWYMNNCICHEHQITDPQLIDRIYRNSTKALVDYGFDGVKLDGCSEFHNTSYWADLLRDSGRAVLIENCHNSRPKYPTDPSVTCPYNFYRTSTDIRPNWGSIMGNLHTTIPFNQNGTSRPGCWAYPDMLEVGQMPSVEEDRTHFAAWAIVSSPLILGFDLTDEDLVQKVWHIISNTEVIAVNQQWGGHAGSLAWSEGSVQVWTKPLAGFSPKYGGAWAALVINTADPTTTPIPYTVAFEKFLGLKGCSVQVRDLFAHNTTGIFSGPSFTTDAIKGHDSRMYTLTPGC
eukprot:Sspe_Gene.19718::Locus_7196_Transcript_1_1_Confidence_1.000_Length_1434::g.19718::m.19718/K07407/E3.2.1.22B, galA, rafA; alpha-galactosidase